MDAITLLKDDHRTVEQLFQRFERAGDRAHVRKRQIVDRIIEELSVHAAVEEQVFYPVARAAVQDAEDTVLESLEEHHVVKWLLSELADLDPAHERFDAKVTVLMESVRHHVQEEERELFPKVRTSLGRTELVSLGDTLAEAKKTAPTRPHPRLPDAPPANAVTGAIGGIVDRTRDNVGDLAEGTLRAVQELIGRITGSSGDGRRAPRRNSSSTASKAKSSTTSPAKSSSGSTAKSSSGSKAKSSTTTSRGRSTAKKTAGPAKKAARTAAARATSTRSSARSR